MAVGYRLQPPPASPQDIERLEREAGRLPDEYTRPAGISWLHRWALAKGREYLVPDEPRVPDYVMKLSGFTSE